LDTLHSLESLLVAGFAPVAILVALWSAQKGLASGPQHARTGEIAWSLVAVAVLLGASAAVHVGIGHGF